MKPHLVGVTHQPVTITMESVSVTSNRVCVSLHPVIRTKRYQGSRSETLPTIPVAQALEPALAANSGFRGVPEPEILHDLKESRSPKALNRQNGLISGRKSSALDSESPLADGHAPKSPVITEVIAGATAAHAPCTTGILRRTHKGNAT